MHYLKKNNPKVPIFSISTCIKNRKGKPFSEALILATTNPQYDKKMFIDLPVQYRVIQKYYNGGCGI